MINQFTPDYGIPDLEILQNTQYEKSVDVWSFGASPFGNCILEIRAYQHTFHAKHKYAYTVRRRRSVWEDYPARLSSALGFISLDMAYDAALESILEYNTSLETF